MKSVPLDPGCHRRAVRFCRFLLLLVAPLAACLQSHPGTEPPPEVHSILLRVIENAARDPEMEARFKASHAFVRVKVTDTLDAEGGLKKRETQREEHHPQRPATPPAPDGTRDNAEAEPRAPRRAYERHDFEVTPALLRRFDFTLAGREELAGRPVWKIDFVPAAAQPPTHGLKEKFLSKTAGRLWVDAAEGFLVRAEFRLTEPMHVVGGLVGSLKHCQVALERARTENGLWFTRQLTWRIEGRKLFSRRSLEHRDEISEIQGVTADQDAPRAAGALPAGPG